MTETKTNRKRSTREQIAPGVEKAGNAYYITTNGGVKYCSAERMEKLLAKVDGSYERLVNEYRVRAPKSEAAEAVMS